MCIIWNRTAVINRMALNRTDVRFRFGSVLYVMIRARKCVMNRRSFLYSWCYLFAYHSNRKLWNFNFWSDLTRSCKYTPTYYTLVSHLITIFARMQPDSRVWKFGNRISKELVKCNLLNTCKAMETCGSSATSGDEVSTPLLQAKMATLPHHQKHWITLKIIIDDYRPYSAVEGATFW